MNKSTGGRAPVVGLVGFYGHGNFGDDLMALIFGLFLRRMGVAFSVYKLCPPYAERFGFTVARSAEELLENADILLWGGGGLLVSWPNLTFRALYPRVTSEYSRLIGQAIRKGIPMMASSVGGDGSCPENLTPSYKQRFVQSAKFISVRNPQDLMLLHRLGTRGEAFADIVWKTAEYFPVRPRKSGGLRIGMDIYLSNLVRRKAVQLLPLLYALTRERRDCEFIFLDTTNRHKKGYRGLGALISGPNIRSYKFSELEPDLEFLASLDLLVSTRLHAPIVCLQHAVPVISLCGEGKTTLMFENLGLQRFSYGNGQIHEFMKLMESRPGLDRFLRDFQFPDVAALRTDSGGHLQKLRDVLSECS